LDSRLFEDKKNILPASRVVFKSEVCGWGGGRGRVGEGRGGKGWERRGERVSGKDGGMEGMEGRRKERIAKGQSPRSQLTLLQVEGSDTDSGLFKNTLSKRKGKEVEEFRGVQNYARESLFGNMDPIFCEFFGIITTIMRCKGGGDQKLILELRGIKERVCFFFFGIFGFFSPALFVILRDYHPSPSFPPLPPLPPSLPSSPPANFQTYFHF
jgi:hypothetical protein